MLQSTDKIYYVDLASELGISQSNARRLLKLYAYIFEYVYEDGWLIKKRPPSELEECQALRPPSPPTRCSDERSR